MNVKEYREAKGYTQEQVAKKLGIKQNTYSDKERGKSGFTVDELLKLEIILGASISELFKDKRKEIEKSIRG